GADAAGEDVLVAAVWDGEGQVWDQLDGDGSGGCAVRGSARLHHEAHFPLFVSQVERKSFMANFISISWLLILAGGTLWTTFFSLFNTPSIRGWRNLGWLACYLIGLAMFVSVPWRIALATWALAGIVSGLVYYC